MRTARRSIVAIGLCSALALSANAVANAGSPRLTASRTVSDPLVGWWQYHGSSTRSGRVRTAPRNPLHRRWSRTLVGSVYGEPLVVGSTLIVATERNYVYGLDARTGRTLWHSGQLGAPARMSDLPCGDIDPLGITGTPAYDPASGLVFVASETTGGIHTLWALDARTGVGRWHRGLDTQPNRDRSAEQQRSALLVTNGRVIVAFGGLAGDCGNYVGYLVSTPTTGRGTSYSYAIPTSREGGIWSTPGPVAGYHGNLYVAAGNGADLTGTWEKSDSVTELTPTKLSPVSAFAPSTWQEDNQQDLDLGSSSPVIVGAVGRLVIAGKRGMVYLLKPTMSGIGSQVAQLNGCTAFGGAAVVDTTVLMPCKGQNSIRALHVGPTSLAWSWTRNGVYSSPVIAGNYVYVADLSSGDLLVLSLAHGNVLGRYHVGAMPHFPSQIVSGGWVFVPSLAGVTAFRGS